MYFSYRYDRDYEMYVERVEDAFGYRSEMEDYDYRYGIPLVTPDMNGYTMETTIDHLGRIQTITAPAPVTGMEGQMNHTYNYDGCTACKVQRVLIAEQKTNRHPIPLP
ncbi:hypothetical protein [Parabacteroides sp. Marseille-P3160]|uniref:hypothetical protein n=1 Tax=Parabacteroides sp. Marseille-P3160 TaxID=1917887 RepID=UPI00350FD9BB